MTKIIGKPTLNTAKVAGVQIVGTGVGALGYNVARAYLPVSMQTKEYDAGIAIASGIGIASIKSKSTVAAIATAVLVGVGISAAGKAVKAYGAQYGSPEVQKVLGITGLGNPNYTYVEDLISNRPPTTISLAGNMVDDQPVKVSLAA